MTPGGQVSFTYEIGMVGTELSVVVKIGPSYPAVIYLSNGDPGYPAQRGEVIDMEVTWPNGTIMDTIPNKLYEALVERAQEEEPI